VNKEIRATRDGSELLMGEKVRMWDDLSPLTEFVAKCDRPILFLNIGSDRSSGDSYGPILGTLLTEAKVGAGVAVIHGTLDTPVHATNLEESIAFCKAKYPNHVWVATDSCLGKSENVGSISFAEGMLTPGTGVNKMLPPVGDYALHGVVNVSGFMEHMVLMSTRLGFVYNLARRSCDAIVAGVAKREQALSKEATTDGTA
jgi:putative sporulation protein YyaC